ncbi:MAG: TIGR04211 family SH3 domain-containing protein [Methylophaga sp.]|nr:TIGR04211 family SH3 domain-containing protein [Methylophaga sp.]
MKILFSVLLITLQLLVSTSSFAATRYVSEELEITMRTGQGVKFGISRMLTSGTKLSVIENNKSSGYSKVRTQSGKTGWVLTRYLSNEPSSRNRAIASAQKVANLELEIAKYKEELQSLSAQNSNSGAENLTLKETSQRLSKELDDLRRTASSAVALDNQNRQLKEKLQQINHDMQAVVIENSALKGSDSKRWFLIGAAVLFGGLLLGLIIPRLRFRKKESW